MRLTPVRSIALCYSAALLMLGATLHAQTAPSAETGTRVRLVAPFVQPKGQLQGSVLAIRGDSLVLHPDGGTGDLTLPFNAMKQVEVSRGVHGNGANGFGLGLLLGAIGGAVGGAASGDDPPGLLSMSAGEKGAIAGLAFGLAGGIVGAIAGSFVRTEKWEPVTTDTLRQRVSVGLAPTRSGAVGLSLALRF